MPRIKITDLDSNTTRPDEAAISRITGGRTETVDKNETITIAGRKPLSAGILLPAVKMGDGSV